MQSSSGASQQPAASATLHHAGVTYNDITFSLLVHSAAIYTSLNCRFAASRQLLLSCTIHIQPATDKHRQTETEKQAQRWENTGNSGWWLVGGLGVPDASGSHSKGAITSKTKHAIKLKTSPARLALLLHNPGRYAVIGCKLKQNANEGCNSCASPAGCLIASDGQS